MEKILEYWSHFEATGIKYGVNPVIFAILYAIHYPLLAVCIVWLVARMRKGLEYAAWIPLAVFILIMPWFYPLFFGHFHWALRLLAIAFIVFAGWHGYHRVHHKLDKEKKKIGTAQKTVVTANAEEG